MRATEGASICFRLPSRLPRLFAYGLVLCAAILLLFRDRELIGAAAFLFIVWVAGMWFVWGRNQLIADDEGLHSHNYFTRYSFTWEEINQVLWLDDVTRQQTWVLVVRNDAHPIDEPITICTIAPMGVLYERKKLRRAFAHCCEAHGLSVV